MLIRIKTRDFDGAVNPEQIAFVKPCRVNDNTWRVQIVFDNGVFIEPVSGVTESAAKMEMGRIVRHINNQWELIRLVDEEAKKL